METQSTADFLSFLKYLVIAIAVGYLVLELLGVFNEEGN